MYIISHGDIHENKQHMFAWNLCCIFFKQLILNPIPILAYEQCRVNSTHAVTPVKAAPPLCLIAITSHFLFFLSRFSSYPKPKKSSWPERGRLINTSVSKKTESCWIVHTCRTVKTFIEGGQSVLDECKLEKMLSSENVPFIFYLHWSPQDNVDMLATFFCNWYFHILNDVNIDESSPSQGG